MSGSIFEGQQVVNGTVCSNLLSTFDLVGNANFVLLMKVQITRMWIQLHQPLCMHYARTRVRNTLQYIHLGFWSRNLFLIAPFPDRCLLLVPFCYNSKQIKIYLEMKSVKLLSVLSIFCE